MVFERDINDRFAGMRLDRYLTDKYTYLSRAGWQKKIQAGSLLLNGKKVKASTAIPKGSRLTYDIGDYQERPVNTNYRVLFHDDHLLIIDKPPDIPVHTSGKYFNNTLIKLLRNDFPGPTLNLVNRLDRETSGIIVLSKNTHAQRTVQFQFRRQEVDKTYIAYVFGTVTDPEFEVEAPIGEHVSGVVRIRMGIDPENGQDALTKFKVVRTRQGFTKLNCFPKTGRTNQIRVHLAHAGYPIVGDKLYSGRDDDFLTFIEQGNTPEILQRLILPRQALHAHRLVFQHPVSKDVLNIVAEEPADLKTFDKQFLNP